MPLNCDAKRAESILLVEDDAKLGAYVQTYLNDHGYQLKWFRDGGTALSWVQHTTPNLVILDLMLPDVDGLDLCRDIRRVYSGPILMFTAREDPINEILGLEIGADDFLFKPVEPRLLLARVHALLRRAQSESVSQKLKIGPLSVHLGARIARVGDQEVSLTSGEFDLLVLLAKSAGEIVSRDRIFQETRGIPYDGMDRSADVKIAQLRKKLSEVSTDADLIRSVRSKGYLMVLPESGMNG